MRLAQQVTDNGYQCQHPICVAGYVYLAGHRGGVRHPGFWMQPLSLMGALSQSYAVFLPSPELLIRLLHNNKIMSS